MNIYYQKKMIPEKAGLANLKYTDIEVPMREKDLISIPKDGYSLYQLLSDFSQFLIIKDVPENVEELSSTKERRHEGQLIAQYKTWFGGTDEQPFLAELTDQPAQITSDWVNLWKINGVFDALKPKGIHMMEELYGEGKTKRQGDFFFYPAPMQEWDELVAFMCLATGAFSNDWGRRDAHGTCMVATKKNYSILGTRHKITGDIIVPECIIDNYIYNYAQMIIGRGIVITPDHTDLVFDELHMIMQARSLKQPQTVD